MTVSLTHLRLNEVPVALLDSCDDSKLDESVAPSGAEICFFDGVKGGLCVGYGTHQQNH